MSYICSYCGIEIMNLGSFECHEKQHRCSHNRTEVITTNTGVWPDIEYFSTEKCVDCGISMARFRTREKYRKMEEEQRKYRTDFSIDFVKKHRGKVIEYGVFSETKSHHGNYDFIISFTDGTQSVIKEAGECSKS